MALPFRGADSYSHHCHHSKGLLAHTTHFSHRANSHRELVPVCFATIVLLDHWPCLMIAESGAPARVKSTRLAWLETALFTAMAVNCPTP